MIAVEDQPGGSAAVACGCTCPTDQPRAEGGIFSADPECPVHGLHLVKALLEEERSAVVFDERTDEEMRDDDEAKTGRVRCIGCGKFVARRYRWNQCTECDTREAWEMR